MELTGSGPKITGLKLLKVVSFMRVFTGSLCDAEHTFGKWGGVFKGEANDSRGKNRNVNKDPCRNWKSLRA